MGCSLTATTRSARGFSCIILLSYLYNSADFWHCQDLSAKRSCLGETVGDGEAGRVGFGWFGMLGWLEGSSDGLGYDIIWV